VTGIDGSLLSAAVSRPPLAIIGVGNALMRDDAFGPHVIRRLERDPRLRSRHDIELVDAGTAGFDLMHHVLGREAVILLDAVAAREGDTPGTLRVLEHHELLAMRGAAARGSPHEPSILAALQVAQLAGELPQVTLVGVVPADLGMGTELSAAVETAVDAAIALVLAHCGPAPQSS
jgi:hydrogenase maturation protease